MNEHKSSHMDRFRCSPEILIAVYRNVATLLHWAGDETVADERSSTLVSWTFRLGYPTGYM